MGSRTANLQQIDESVFAVIGDDGATNFGIVKAKDSSAILIDADIRRMDEIEDALHKTGCSKVRYLVNSHENFDHSSANDYFELMLPSLPGALTSRMIIWREAKTPSIPERIHGSNSFPGQQ